jgi:SAM-dependent methyltransferase
MLAQAHTDHSNLLLVRGRSECLPFKDASLDLVYCVNALHHFDEPRGFMSEARRLLRRGGALAVIGMDPHSSLTDWYVYHYFAGTLETDRARFPTAEALRGWMEDVGLGENETTLLEQIHHPLSGQSVFEDPFLQKDATSQLVLLTDQAYADGISRMRQALAEAEAGGVQITFPVDIPMCMTVGRAHGERNG